MTLKDRFRLVEATIVVAFGVMAILVEGNGGLLAHSRVVQIKIIENNKPHHGVGNAPRPRAYGPRASTDTRGDLPPRRDKPAAAKGLRRACPLRV